MFGTDGHCSLPRLAELGAANSIVHSESFGIRKGLREGIRIGLEVEVVVLMLLGVEMRERTRGVRFRGDRCIEVSKVLCRCARHTDAAFG